MSDEKALLAAIWEHPHEDTPRLVYADWLDEHEQPERAEFIRVQCELARFDEWDDSPLKAELAATEKALWAKWKHRWRAHLPKGRKNCSFERGFPKFDLARHSFDGLLKLTPNDLAPAPLSRYHYNFEGRLLRDFLAWPGLRFQELFSPRPPGLRTGWVEEVAACANLRNVSELCTIDCPLKPGEVKLLLDAWADRHLPSLSLAGRIRDEGAGVLAAHPTFAKVKDLDLRGAGFTAEGLRLLLASPHATNLRSVNLAYCPLGNAGLEELARSPRLAQVRRLILNSVRAGRRGVEALAASPHAAGLQELGLSSNRLAADACRALIGSPHLSEIRRLYLYGNPGVEATGKELRRRFGRTTVTW